MTDPREMADSLFPLVKSSRACAKITGALDEGKPPPWPTKSRIYTIPMDEKPAVDLSIKYFVPILLLSVGGWVVMIIWRVGTMSGSFISVTAMLVIHALLTFRRERYSVIVLFVLLASGLPTLWILGEAASRAEVQVGSSLREIDVPARWVFFGNYCLYTLMLVISICVRRYRKRRR